MAINPLVIQTISSIALEVGVDPVLALAIAAVESNYNTGACRFEVNWKYFYKPDLFAKQLGITVKTEYVLQQISWGCMQVMGSVARELNFTDHLNTLTDPEKGIFYGCLQLKRLGKTWKTRKDLIAAYNAGTAIQINGRYKNQQYVDKVLVVFNSLDSGRGLH